MAYAAITLLYHYWLAALLTERGKARLNRYTQLALWMVLAPIFGAIQALASFSLVMLSVGDLGSHDLGRVLLGLTFIYGGGWFLGDGYELNIAD